MIIRAILYCSNFRLSAQIKNLNKSFNNILIFLIEIDYLIHNDILIKH